MCKGKLHKLFVTETSPAEAVGTTKRKMTTIPQTPTKTRPKTQPAISSDFS